MVTTAARLRWLREEVAKIQRPELECLAGLAKGHVWLIENGRRKDIGSSTASRIGRVLGCAVEWLTTGEGEPPDLQEVLSRVAAARTRHLETNRKPTGTDG